MPQITTDVDGHRNELSLRIGVAVFAIAVIATQLLGAWPADGAWWGADAWRFISGSARAWCLGVTAGVVWLAMRPRGPIEARPESGTRRAVVFTLVLVLAGALFWLLRIRHVLLGDGIPITALLPEEHELHPREPLTSLIQQALWTGLRSWFDAPGLVRADVVKDCVAVGSVLCGVAFVAVARFLAAELARLVPAEREDRRLVPLLTLVLLAQGYVQVFFGYVENYSYEAVAMAAYLMAALRFQRGAASILWPIVAFVTAMALHLSAVVLAPSVAVLAALALRDPARRARVLRDLAIAAIAVLAIVFWLERGPARYPVLSHVVTLLQSGRAGADYLLSAAHVRDFVNEHLLLGPIGLLAFVPLLVLAIATRRVSRAHAVIVAAALAGVAACWSAPDLPLGYARDWDLYAPLGVVLAVGTLAVVLAIVRAPAARVGVAGVALTLSLLHTAPWIVLNTSEARSLERFASLPLGFGRTENTIAAWHAQRGDYVQAKAWIRKAVIANPGNIRALDLFGRIALEEGDVELAVRTYDVALVIAPERLDLRRQMVASLLEAGDAKRARVHSDTLVALHGGDVRVWLERVAVLRACGDEAGAGEAARRAHELRPDLARAAGSRSIDAPGSVAATSP